jgi:hypothetical protein
MLLSRFKGNQLLLRTVKPVRAGQPLTISYGPQAGELATPLRQQQLLEGYGFWCSCDACEAGGAGVGAAAGMTAQEAAAVGLRCVRSSCAGKQLSKMYFNLFVFSARWQATASQ